MFGTQWPIYYIALGTAVIAATLAVAARSPRHTWIWHICLLAGLAVSSAGAIGVEELRYEEICRSLGLLSGRGCQAYQIEESLEFLGIWLTLIAVLGQFSDAAPRPRPLVRRILYLLPMFLFIHLLLPNSYLQPVHLEYQFLAQPLSVEYESDVGLLGYRTNREEGAFAKASRITRYSLFGKTLQLPVGTNTPGWAIPSIWWIRSPVREAIHRLRQLDASASRRDQGRINLNVHGKRYLWMYKQRIAVQFPAKTPTNRALWVVITTWREEDDAFVSQSKIISSDHQLLGDTQVVLGELVLPAEPARSTTVPFAEFDNEF